VLYGAAAAEAAAVPVIMVITALVSHMVSPADRAAAVAVMWEVVVM
jgi:hypothetical protein